MNAAIAEERGWRYINMTRDTANKDYVKQYQDYVQNVLPKVALANNKADQKILKSPFLSTLKQDKAYHIIIKAMEVDEEIFNEKNIPLPTEISLLAQEYSSIQSSMTIQLNGKELTLQQASIHLESHDRKLRETTFLKVNETRQKSEQKLNEMFSDMVAKRHEIAKNAGFKNFIDYSFAQQKKFHYTPEDCHMFHKAVETEIMPLMNELATIRKETLGVNQLRPWDLKVELSDQPPLKPFNSKDELIKKTTQVFNQLDPFFADCLTQLNQADHLDLMSRKNKAPGGYNYPLDLSKKPFIFMNATHTFDDMITLLHEGGHAIHSFLTKDLALHSFKHPPIEACELASMSMELLSLKYWNVFFPDAKDLLRAKKLLLERTLIMLPWIACIDKFQHWIYAHPTHTIEERKEAWNKIFSTYNEKIIDWRGYEHYKDFFWQKQLHLFEVPFYYIEYAIAGLGAIGMWKLFKNQPEKALDGYKKALSIGNQIALPAIFQQAHLAFRFDQAHIKDLAKFVRAEMSAIQATKPMPN